MRTRLRLRHGPALGVRPLPAPGQVASCVPLPARQYPVSPTVETADVVIVGGGAAGLATAIFTKRAAPGLRVICLDGARRVGAKILVSGGARCNVTNRIVTELDFWGGSPRTIRSVLRAFPADRAAAFFEGLGVRLHEEEDGKLFPRHEPRAHGARRIARRSRACRRGGDRVDRRVVGVRARGRGVPDRNGGDGSVSWPRARPCDRRSIASEDRERRLRVRLARGLGHGYVETTPALAPLVLDGTAHAALSGIAHPAALTVGGCGVRLSGSLLWTHFGLSGPLALNASRHWHRARAGGVPPTCR